MEEDSTKQETGGFDDAVEFNPPLSPVGQQHYERVRSLIEPKLQQKSSRHQDRKHQTDASANE